MRVLWSLILTSLVTLLVTAQDPSLEEILHQINETFSDKGNLEIEARWNYITDITTEHEEAMVSLVIMKMKITVMVEWKWKCFHFVKHCQLKSFCSLLSLCTKSIKIVCFQIERGSFGLSKGKEGKGGTPHEIEHDRC